MLVLKVGCPVCVRALGGRILPCAQAGRCWLFSRHSNTHFSVSLQPSAGQLLSKSIKCQVRFKYFRADPNLKTVTLHVLDEPLSFNANVSVS